MGNKLSVAERKTRSFYGLVGGGGYDHTKNLCYKKEEGGGGGGLCQNKSIYILIILEKND